VENQDFPHGKFVLSPKFAGLRQNGGLKCRKHKIENET